MTRVPEGRRLHLNEKELPILSPDGAHQWVGGRWVPYVGGAPPTANASSARKRSSSPVAGLLLCVVAGLVFLAIAGASGEAGAVMMPFVFFSALGAVIFGMRVATSKACSACRSQVSKAASLCGRCGAGV